METTHLSLNDDQIVSERPSALIQRLVLDPLAFHQFRQVWVLFVLRSSVGNYYTVGIESRFLFFEFFSFLFWKRTYFERGTAQADLCASIVRRDEAVVSDWVEVQDGALGGCGGEGGGYDGAGCEEEVGDVHCFWGWVGLVGCVGIGVNSEGSEVQRDVFGKGLYEVWGVFGSHLCTRLLAFLGLGFLGGACGVLLIVRPRFFLSIDAFAYSGNGSDVALYRSQRRVAWNGVFG